MKEKIHLKNSRKRSASSSDHVTIPQKRLRLNGNSKRVSLHYLPKFTSPSKVNTSTNLKNSKQNIVKGNSNKSKSKEEESVNSKIPRQFDKSKFKIRLGPKTNKSPKLLRNNSKGKFKSKDCVQRLLKNKEVELQGSQKKLEKDDIELQGTGVYYLKFKKESAIPEGRLNFKFEKLITDVKNIKLPSDMWKIKVIIKQNKISAITFTNKQELERSVTFSLRTDRYKLLINNKVSHLLASPETIDTSEDIEVLLEIIEHLDAESPIIFYR